MKNTKNNQPKPFNAEPTEMAASIRVAIANDEMAENKPLNVTPITKQPEGEVLLDSTGERMSHIEIAKVAGKRSDSLKRTIERLVRKGAIASPPVVERPKDGVPGQFVEHLMLGRIDSITVMASVDGKYCVDLVKRWDDLESGRAKPTLEQQPVLPRHYDEPEPPADPYKKLQMDMEATISALEFAEKMGFDKNQALLLADRIIKRRLDFSPLEEMEQTALVAPVQEMTYTPTELGKFYTPAYSPVTMNQMLQQAGMQERINDRWMPTDRGKEFSEILDVGKAHRDGTPVKQVKWLKSVLDHLLPVVSQSPADMYAAPAYEGAQGTQSKARTQRLLTRYQR